MGMNNHSANKFITKKRYITETDEPDSANSSSNPITKKKFVLKSTEEMQQKHTQDLKIFVLKMFIWLTIALVVMLGHFYFALFILWSASYNYKEVISLNRAVQKEYMITFSWLDWYWYSVAAFLILPRVFLRRNIMESIYMQSEFLKSVLYTYNAMIAQILVLVGSAMTVLKLNRGYVKYQIKRNLWAALMLIYIFILSTFWIYNLYHGYIWVLFPIFCIRANSLVTKVVYENRGRVTPFHKYVPKLDEIALLYSFIFTGLFAFFASGYFSSFQHLVCQQEELSLKVFEAKTCNISPVYQNQTYHMQLKNFFSEDNPDQVLFETSFQCKPVQIHMTVLALLGCIVQPLCRFGATITNKAFGVKEEILAGILGCDSTWTDIFYCNGVLGIIVALYLQQVVFREHFYLENAMYYASVLDDADKQKLVQVLQEQLANAAALAKETAKS